MLVAARVVRGAAAGLAVTVPVVRLPRRNPVGQVVLVTTDDHLRHDAVVVKEGVVGHQATAQLTVSEPAVIVVTLSLPSVAVEPVSPTPSVIV